MTSPLLTVDDLNRQFAIAGSAEFLAGNGGLTKLRVQTALATAEIYLHGAQVTSWRPAGQKEVLFLSAQSYWQAGKAIRGGVPICFPWFRSKADNPQAPAHGFLRTRAWNVDSVTLRNDGAVVAIFSSSSDDSTCALWPYEFRVTYTVVIGQTLELDLTIDNLGESAFHFEEALHTYFEVGDAASVRVHGLDGVTYLDNTADNQQVIQSGDVIFDKTTDNAYLETTSACDLVDPTYVRIIRTEKTDSSTTVVWNPWSQGAAKLADLGNDEWMHMTCVEACNILDAEVELQPGASHTFEVTLSVEPIDSSAA